MGLFIPLGLLRSHKFIIALRRDSAQLPGRAVPIEMLPRLVRLKKFGSTLRCPGPYAYDTYHRRDRLLGARVMIHGRVILPVPQCGIARLLNRKSLPSGEWSPGILRVCLAWGVSSHR